MSSRKSGTGTGILGISLIVAAIAVSIHHQSNHIHTQQALKLTPLKQLPPSYAFHKIIAQPQYYHAKTITVKAGDTLASIFESVKLSAAILEEATASPHLA